MGLNVKISAQEQENSFYVYDCTGNYSSENKGGYGVQNPKMQDVIESFLYIQGPSDKEEYPWKIDVTGSLPNDDGIAYEVVPVEIGQTELESGKYKMKLVHFIKDRFGVIKDRTGYGVEVFINNIACCVDSKMPGVDQNAATDPNQKLVIELNAMLVGVKAQISEGLYDKANQTIDYMKQQCKCSGC